MAAGHMAGGVAGGVQQRQLHLQRAVGQQAGQLRLGLILVGIKFRIKMRSGRMSWLCARSRCMTKTFSSESAR